MCNQHGEVFGEKGQNEQNSQKNREFGDFDESDLNGSDYSYAVRKTIIWNMIYISSLVRKFQSLQRDVLVLLKRLKSYCKLVNIFVEGEIENNQVSPGGTCHFVKSSGGSSVRRSESTNTRLEKTKIVRRSKSLRRDNDSVEGKTKTMWKTLA